MTLGMQPCASTLTGSVGTFVQCFQCLLATPLLVKLWRQHGPKPRGQTGMALSLDIGFSGVILPIAIAMSNFLKLVARSIEQGKCLGAALDRTGFDAVRAIRHLVSGDGLQQSSDEMVLPLFWPLQECSGSFSLNGIKIQS